VQAQIWQEAGNSSTRFDSESGRRFLEKVGWLKNQQLLSPDQIDPSDSSPKGSLPVFPWWVDDTDMAYSYDLGFTISNCWKR